ncbi:SCO family protein [Roseibium sp. RKSG952]|uniref:SCO family protein n=1 Tax=Roseibium sp. RKSG952 TaxID=2529384 RepID=UPI0012BC1C94|nr:SCO family protein [Roseibium sp. RKSG952]MTH96302.1 SCO family protein [Roseibium sp. RKSG952]
MTGSDVLRFGRCAALAAFATVSGMLADIEPVRAEQTSDALTPQAGAGGPFELVNADGETVTDKDYADKPKVVFFGYTYCPDICPLTMSDVRIWMENLGPDADKLHYIFVTVDPERDTPDVVGDYAAAFDDRIEALSGSQAQVDAVVETFQAYAEKAPLDDGGYNVHHTAEVLLMDRKNRLVDTIAYQEEEDIAVSQLRQLIDTGSRSF